MTDRRHRPRARRPRGRWAAPAPARRSGSGGRCARPDSSIDLGAAVDFARALTLVDIGDREQVRAAGAAVFVRRRDDRAVYDAAFDRWWRQRGSRFSDEFQPSTLRSPDDAMVEEEAPGDQRQPPERRRGPAARSGQDERGTPIPSEGEHDGDDEAPIEAR